MQDAQSVGEKSWQTELGGIGPSGDGLTTLRLDWSFSVFLGSLASPFLSAFQA